MKKPVKIAIIVASSVVVSAVVLFFIIFGATGGFSKKSDKSAPINDDTPAPAPLPVESASTQYAVWSWEVAPFFTNNDATAPIADASLDLSSPYFALLSAQSTITDIYLQVDRDVPIVNLNLLVKELTARNIACHALDGSTEMFDASPGGGRARYDLMLAYVQSYQSAFPQEPLRGIHLDVESWGGKGDFSDPTSSRISDWQSFMLQARSDAHALGLVLGIDVNAGFRNRNYDNEVHGQGLLSEWTGKYMDFVVVMAYRDLVTGPNSIEALSKLQIAFSSPSDGTNTLNTNTVHQKSRYQRANGFAGVAIGIETLPSDEVWSSADGKRSISFAGQTKAAVVKALGEIDTVFASQSGFAGVVVHDMNGFIALKNSA